MTTNANELVELTRILNEKLGETGATLIMARLPDDPTTNFATRDDVAANTVALRGEMSELRGEMSELRGEMSELRGELRSEMSELRTEMAAGFAAQQRFLTTSLIAIVGLNVASIGVAVGLTTALG